jgi:hypothetical protein
MKPTARLGDDDIVFPAETVAKKPVRRYLIGKGIACVPKGRAGG